MDDREQFGAFVEQHARGLHRTAWLLTGDWQAAEDLVQTTLVTSWLHWGAVREPAARLSYVRRVLTTTFLRGQRRRWTGELSLGWQPDGIDPVDAIAALLGRHRQESCRPRAVDPARTARTAGPHD